MANVRFIKTTKEKHINRETYDPNALYFCEDTQEIYKGQYPYTEGIKVIRTKADLPSCPCAADGVVYFVSETKSGYMMSPDRTEWLQTIYAPVTDAYTIPEEEMYTTVTTVGAVRDIEEKIYKYIDETAGTGIGNLRPVDGTLVIANAEGDGKTIGVAISTEAGNALVAKDDGLYVNSASVKIANESHGLVAVDGELLINLATADSDGAMSKEDKKVIEAIPSVYVARQYEIVHKPDGTLVDYRDKEIRIMCPVDTEWKPQDSGENANANMYYIGFKAYAPQDAFSFKEDLKETIENDTMYYFEGEFAGIDAYGRKYSIVWLPAASYAEGTWTYYGSMSSDGKYIGWYYTVEWYNKSGIVISNDQIRINLSNESCHNNIKPYWMGEVITADEAESIKMTIATMEESYSWIDM